MLRVCIFFSILICLFLFESAFAENSVLSIWIASVIERNFLNLSFGCDPFCDWKIGVDDAVVENEKNMTKKKQKNFCDQFATWKKSKFDDECVQILEKKKKKMHKKK